LTLNAVGSDVRVINMGDSATMTGEIVLDGNVRLQADPDSVLGAEIIGDELSALEFNGAAAAAVDLEDISVGNIRVDADAIVFDKAEGQLITLISSGAGVIVNTSSDGGVLDIVIDANNGALAVGGDNAGNDPLLDSANVRFTSKANVVTAISAGGTMALTFDDDTTVSLLTGSADAILTVESESNLVWTSIDTISDINMSDVSGSVTVLAVDSVVGGMTVTTGSGADSVTLFSASATLSTGAGNDVVTVTGLSVMDSAFINLGAGDDKVVFGSATTAIANTALVIDGGDGADIIDLNATSAMTMSVATLTIRNVEEFQFKDDFYGDAKTFTGQTITMKAEAAAGEMFHLATAATDKALDISTITIDASVEDITSDLTTVLATSAFTYTGNARGETVITPTGIAAFGYTLDLGAGNDVLQISGQTSSVALTGGSVTLGAGNDTVALYRSGVSTSQSQALSDLSDLSDLVTITDFTLGADRFTGQGAALTVASDVTVGAGLALGGDSGVGSLTSVVQSATLWDDVVAYVKDGKILLAGSDAGSVNTLEEWMYTARLLVSAGTVTDGEVLGFEYDGATFVTIFSSDGTTTIEQATIKLDGVVDAKLGSGSGSDTVQIV
jgi:hypothetical protein